jgi:PTH2 family peptidyl-tRNA hydrolase
MAKKKSLADRLRAVADTMPEHEVYVNFQTLTLLEAADRLDELEAALNPPHGKLEKLRIYINRGLNITPNKRAAHAVHAALQAFGVHPGVKVIVLDAGPTKIDAMRVTIRDAGHTELEPGTLTAGTNWPEDSQP